MSSEDQAMNDKTTKATEVAPNVKTVPPKWDRTWEDRVKLTAAQKERKAAKRKERYETDPEHREKVKALSKLHRDERKAVKVAVSSPGEKTDAPPLG